MIDDNSFNGCSNLAEIDLPSGLTTIDSNAFKSCSSLAAIDLPSGLTTIGDQAFCGTGITSISIPASVTDMWCAFRGCTTLDSVYFGEGIASVSRGALYGSSVRYAIIPQSASQISNSAFHECSSIEEVEVLGKTTRIGDSNVFPAGSSVTLYCWESSPAHTYADQNGLNFVLYDTPLNNADFTLPFGTVLIEEEAFTGIKARRIRLGEHVQSIGNKVFKDCTELLQIYIPECCTTIEQDAFENVTGITIFGVIGSRAHLFAQEKGFSFRAIDLTVRIRQYLLGIPSGSAYDATLDLNNDGVINITDYILARQDQ